MKNRARLWTDGCCLRNPGGAGGWAFVAEVGNEVLHRAAGREGSTTNNRMELMAVIAALRWLPPELGRVEVISDSRYVVDGATQWMAGWKMRGWQSKRPRGGKRARGTKRRPIKNVDLWQEIDRLTDGRVATVAFRWVRGHVGHSFNELADQLAGEAARNRYVEPDEAEAWVDAHLSAISAELPRP